MKYTVTYTAFFEKEAKRLAKKYPSLIEDITNLISLLEVNPEQGMPLGKGLYKIRIAIKGKGQGKSGGARVITYIAFNHDIVYLTSIYDKAEQSTISAVVLIKILKEEGVITK